MNERAYNTAYIAMAVSLKFREDIDMVCWIACQAENIMYTLGITNQTVQYILGVFISNDLLNDNEMYRNGESAKRILELLQEVLTRDQKVELMRKMLTDEEKHRLSVFIKELK